MPAHQPHSHRALTPTPSNSARALSLRSQQRRSKTLLTCALLQLTSALSPLSPLSPPLLAQPEVSQGAQAPLNLLTMSEEEAPYLSKPEGVINQLRWVNLRARKHLLRLNPKAQLTLRESASLLQKARLGLLERADVEVIFELRGALPREGLKADPSYPLLLVTLARAERRQGLTKSAQRHLNSALTAGQSSSVRYEEALLSYLQEDQEAHTLSDLKRFWGRYVELCAKANKGWSEPLRYHYGKALYFQGALDESEQLMGALAQGRDFAVRSKYLLGLIALKRGAPKQAIEALTELHTLIKRVRARQKKRPAEPPELELVQQVGALKVERLKPQDDTDDDQSTAKAAQKDPQGLDSELLEVLERAERELEQERDHISWGQPKDHDPTPLKEPLSVLEEVEVALELSRARLALVRGDYEEAWQRYRGVPAGLSWSREALLESVYLLRMQGSYEQAANLIDQLLKERALEPASFELMMWRAECLVKAGYQEEGRERYKELSGLLAKQRRVLETSLNSELKFPDEVLAWVGEREARLARSLDRELSMMRLYVRQAQLEWNELYAAAERGELTSIKLARAFLSQQARSLGQLKARLPALEAPWRRWASVRRASPAQGDVSTGRVLESLERLGRRLSDLAQLTQEREATLRRSLLPWLKGLRLEVEGLIKRLSALEQSAGRLDALLKREALKRVGDMEARLMLGPTEVFFWDKERESERLFAQRSARLSELKKISDLKQESDDAQATFELLDELIMVRQRLSQPEGQLEGQPEGQPEEQGAPFVEAGAGGEASAQDALNAPPKEPSSSLEDLGEL